MRVASWLREKLYANYANLRTLIARIAPCAFKMDCTGNWKWTWNSGSRLTAFPFAQFAFEDSRYSRPQDSEFSQMRKFPVGKPWIFNLFMAEASADGNWSKAVPLRQRRHRLGPDTLRVRDDNDNKGRRGLPNVQSSAPSRVSTVQNCSSIVQALWWDQRRVIEKTLQHADTFPEGDGPHNSRTHVPDTQEKPNNTSTSPLSSSRSAMRE